MVATWCLLVCALSTGQVNGWQLQPQLARGQELVYSGSFTEETASPGVQFIPRAYKVDATVLVLEATNQKFDLAFLTIVTTKAPKSTAEPAKTAATPSSVRLEISSVDRQGKLLPRLPGSLSLLPPLEGPPTAECGFFVEAPKGRVGIKHVWDVNEEGRTPRSWRVDGTEVINNVQCVRLVGIQQSEDWDTPRADRASWQRCDTVWFAPQFGLTYKFERVIKRRDAARASPNYRSELSCQLDTNSTYPGKLFESRQAEIKQARKFYEDADAWLRDLDLHKGHLENLLRKIKQYSDAEAPTPYRKAITQVQTRVEAGLRGETIPNPQADTVPAHMPKTAVGQRVPDFACTDLLTSETYRLQRALGKPVVILFYSPTTENGQRALRLGQSLTQRFPQAVNIMAMAVTDDADHVRKQHKEMNLPFTILDGKGLAQFFGADALPRIVVLDAEGVVRLADTGWGAHTPVDVNALVQKLIPR